MNTQIQEAANKMGVCDTCGAIQFLSYITCNYNGVCKGKIIPQTESKEVSKCSHKNITSIDNTCIKCTDCGALSYHRDSGGIGQPKEKVWLNAHLPAKEVSNVSDSDIFNDKNPVTFTLAEVRNIVNGITETTGFWDYMKKSKFADRIRNAVKEEPVSVSVEEAALKILAEELTKSDVRKHTCLNGFGYSQLERDIVSKLTNWQKEQDKAIIGELLEALRKSNKAIDRMAQTIVNEKSIENSYTGMDVSLANLNLITKATNYLNQQ